MKMAVFSIIASCILVEVYRLSDVLTSYNIRIIAGRKHL
jgi:hypothetical protein